MKQIQRYVAFNPSSSNNEEWWTAKTLKELSSVFWVSCVTNKRIKKIGNGFYIAGSIEIYDVKLHTKAIEGLE